jgi:hypothetical protein
VQNSGIIISSDYTVLQKWFRCGFKLKHLIFVESAIFNSEEIRIKEILFLKILENIKIGAFDDV